MKISAWSKPKTAACAALFFLTVACLPLFGQSPATRRVDFSCRNLLPAEALQQLSRQTGVAVAFSSQIFEACPPVSVAVSQARLEDVVKKIVACVPEMSWKWIGEQLVLFRAERFFTLSGYVSDSASGERLIGATLRVLPGGRTGACSNEFGFYSLTLPQGEHRLLFSYIGCQARELKIDLRQNTRFDPVLSSLQYLPEVVVEAPRGDSAAAGRSPEIELAGLGSLPSPGGEPDLFRLAAQEPGVASGVDGLGGLYIRGGNADQNLILLDDVPIYSPGHALGLYSIFNPATLKSVRLWKGDPPATYGGRAASAFDIRTRDGDMQRPHAAVSAGLFAGTVAVDGPLERDRSAFLVSGRTTYLSPWLRLYERKSRAEFLPDTGLDYRFHDLNVKLNRIFSEKNRLYFSLYAGGDRFRQDFQFRFEDTTGVPPQEYTSRLANDWGNFTASLRWNSVLSPRFFVNNTLIVSDFKQSYRRAETVHVLEQPGVYPEVWFARSGVFRSRVRDIGLKTDLSCFASARLTLRAGAGVTVHRFQPGVRSENLALQVGELQIDSLQALNLNDTVVISTEPHAYLLTEWQPGRGWAVNLGLHAGASLGKSGRFVSVQPRFFLEKKWGRDLALFASASRMTQFLHQIGTQNTGFQSELWAPASRVAPPEHSWLLSAGLSSRFRDWEASATGFWRRLENIAAFSRSDNLSAFTGDGNLTNWESAVDIGTGKSKGLELELRKQGRKTRFAAAYTWSDSRRQFRQLNEGRPFPFRFDRRHDLKISLSRQVFPWLECYVFWQYGSGMPVTLGNAKFLNFDGHANGSQQPFPQVFDEVVAIASINNFRLPAYHHLDFALTARFSTGKLRHLAEAGMYNAYDRTNPFAIYLYNSSPAESKVRVLQYSLLPSMPVLRYEVRF